MGQGELLALLNLSPWCLVMVLAVPWGCLRFVIVVFPDHTHLLFLDQDLLTKYFRSAHDMYIVNSHCFPTSVTFYII